MSHIGSLDQKVDRNRHMTTRTPPKSIQPAVAQTQDPTKDQIRLRHRAVEPHDARGRSSPSDAYEPPEHSFKMLDVALLRKLLEYPAEASCSETFSKLVVSEQQFKLRGQVVDIFRLEE